MASARKPLSFAIKPRYLKDDELIVANELEGNKMPNTHGSNTTQLSDSVAIPCNLVT